MQCALFKYMTLPTTQIKKGDRRTRDRLVVTTSVA